MTWLIHNANKIRMSSTVRRISSYGLLVAEKEVLLSRLTKGPNTGRWNLVGGEIEFGEEPEKAFRRELKEESGIVFESKLDLIAVLSECPGENFQIIGIVYSVILDKKIECEEFRDGDSSDGCRWFKIDELEKIETTSFVSEAIVKLFRNDKLQS